MNDRVVDPNDRVQVKLNVSRSGTDGAFEKGDVISVPRVEAGVMLSRGTCTLVDPAETVEKWDPDAEHQARVAAAAVGKKETAAKKAKAEKAVA